MTSAGRAREGAGWMAGGIVVAVGVVATVIMNRPAGEVDSRILSGWIRVFEALCVSLVVAWSAFAVLSLWAFLTGELAVGCIRNTSERDIAKNSRWTARLMLSLPAAAFLSITLAGWALLSWALQPLLAGIVYRPDVPPSREPGTTVVALAQVLLGTAGTIALPVILAAAAIAALPAVWGLIPVVWPEVKPPALHRARDMAYSNRLGRWLTRTFGGLKFFRLASCRCDDLCISGVRR